MCPSEHLLALLTALASVRLHEWINMRSKLIIEVRPFEALTSGIFFFMYMIFLFIIGLYIDQAVNLRNVSIIGHRGERYISDQSMKRDRDGRTANYELLKSRRVGGDRGQEVTAPHRLLPPPAGRLSPSSSSEHTGRHPIISTMPF